MGLYTRAANDSLSPGSPVQLSAPRSPTRFAAKRTQRKEKKKKEKKKETRETKQWQQFVHVSEGKMDNNRLDGPGFCSEGNNFIEFMGCYVYVATGQKGKKEGMERHQSPRGPGGMTKPEPIYGSDYPGAFAFLFPTIYKNSFSMLKCPSTAKTKRPCRRSIAGKHSS